MSDDDARLMALLIELFTPLKRQSPGSEQSTLRAWQALPELPTSVLLADLGCGNGASTEILARQPGVRVISLDASIASLVALQGRVRATGTGSGVQPIAGDMLAVPLAEESCDVVWAEGSVYAVGFIEALAAWRRLLRPGGYIVVNEAVWLTDTPPEAAREFWSEAYPRMATVEDNQRFLGQAGYQLLEHFVQPASDWQAYYEPLEERLTHWLANYPDDPLAEQVHAMVRYETDLWRNHGESYGYCFYIARKLA